MTMTKEIQDNDFLYDVLNRHYFESYRTDSHSAALEVYLYGLCKSNCEYCYLKQHQEELYPAKLNDIPTILHNFELLIDWYIENKFICMIDFFSGEWLTTSLFEPIMQIMYDKFSKTKYRPKRILGADNMQFLWDEKRTKLIEYWFDKFFTDLDIDISLSASIDGAICDYGRVQGTDEFYDRLWNFCKKYQLRAHPMVSAHNVKDWIPNYLWWVNNAPPSIWRGLMMLEVRNEEWHEQEINDLIKFCDFLVDFQFKNIFNENKLDFLKHILNMKDEEKYPFTSTGYRNIALGSNGFTDGQDIIQCSFHNECAIRLGDLAIVPCHRLSYKDLIIGKFNVENNKITGIKAINPVLAVLKGRLKQSNLPHCATCDFVGICAGFCLGNSYEISKNFLIPAKEVCQMYKAKNSFLIYKYEQMGLWKLLPQLEEEYNPTQLAYLKSLKDKVLSNLIKQ